MHEEASVLCDVGQNVRVRDRQREVADLSHFIVAVFQADRSERPVLRALRSGTSHTSATSQVLLPPNGRHRPTQIVHVQAGRATDCQLIRVLNHIYLIHVARNNYRISSARLRIPLNLISPPNMHRLVLATTRKEMPLVIADSHRIHRILMLV